MYVYLETPAGCCVCVTFGKANSLSCNKINLFKKHRTRAVAKCKRHLQSFCLKSPPILSSVAHAFLQAPSSSSRKWKFNDQYGCCENVCLTAPIALCKPDNDNAFAFMNQENFLFYLLSCLNRIFTFLLIIKRGEINRELDNLADLGELSKQICLLQLRRKLEDGPKNIILFDEMRLGRVVRHNARMTYNSAILIHYQISKYVSSESMEPLLISDNFNNAKGSQTISTSNSPSENDCIPDQFQSTAISSRPNKFLQINTLYIKQILTVHCLLFLWIPIEN
ncbi:hypothetical protein EGR_06795 [Echinococcus granulosus]|uniref:Uncharacterized protein n=1 Tax=Echinococcus granulosus TaxID=6210 RepID=W6UAG3_ECHGR|nr:hypothetical protein EGR_06795 [Echinococcus granulosus]EUB58388.1 hypothetical protein EGR_06795 [Echinococcus granulosus]